MRCQWLRPPLQVIVGKYNLKIADATGAQRNSRQLEQQPAGQAVVAKAAQQRTKAGRGFKCGQPVCIPTVIDKHEQVDNSSAGVT